MNSTFPPGSGNPLRAEADWPPVVVGGAFQTGLNLMRDLLRKGVKTIAVDHDSAHEGFRSAYGKTYHCPNPDSDGAQWLQFMKDISGQLGRKPIFIPAADIFVMAIARYAPELANYYLNEPQAAALQADLCSKETQYALCAKHGFPCPRHAYVKSRADLDHFAAKARFPCLLKPLSPREWATLPPDSPAYGKKIVIAKTSEEMKRVYDAVAPHRPEAIAQEVIAGLGNQKRLYFSAFGVGGKLLGHCLAEEFRPYPALADSPQIVHSIQNPELTELCRSFLEKLAYRGICEFEFKLDERDGQPRLIEINPRFSGAGDSAGYSGIETGWLHYLDAIGYPVVQVEAIPADVHHIILKLEASKTLPFVLNGSISWKEFFAPYRSNGVYYDFDRHDPKLAIETILICARYAAGTLLRHIRGRSILS